MGAGTGGLCGGLLARDARPAPPGPYAGAVPGVRSPFRLERYLADLRDRTAWAPDCPIEETAGPRVARATLHRIAHLWALALLDDRFETLLLPVLATSPDLLDALEAENR